MFSGAWNWASDAYQWAKDQVIELASILTFDLIPRDVFVFALDAAMASMGIPPDIPNLDQLMKEGVDGLAKEMAKAAMTQIPAADLAAMWAIWRPIFDRGGSQFVGAGIAQAP